MKILILLLLHSSLSFASSLWKEELTCTKKTTFMNRKTEIVLGESIDAQGLDRELDNTSAQCKIVNKTLNCRNGKSLLQVDISKKYRDNGIVLPLGQRVGAYNYYKAKLTKGSFSFFSVSLRCRGEVESGY